MAISAESFLSDNDDPVISENYTRLNNSLENEFIAFQTDYLLPSTKDDTSKKNIISARIGGLNVVLGILYERLLTKFLGIEAGIGLLGVSVGSNFYSPWLTKNRNLNIQAGVSQSWGWSGSLTYFPVGVNLMTKKNLRFGLDAGPQLWHEDNDLVPSGSLRIGKVF